jgi:hypothetical protein
MKLNVIIKTSVDKGFVNPINGSSSFNSNPVNIKNVKLNPMQMEKTSAIFNFSNFKNLVITMPGARVR